MRETASTGPDRECPLCARLAAYRTENREREPTWFNAPVPSFRSSGGADGVRLLIVGLAPGLRGANRTGRPFTGDAAGELLYTTLVKFGFAQGDYRAEQGDGFGLLGCQITNAVRCVPPGNRPIAAEVNACRPFLAAEIAALARLSGVLALGTIAHASVVAALGNRQSAYPFRHGAVHGFDGGLFLADSYHCSRYNLNTGRLTGEMFEAVFAELRRRLDRKA